MKKIIFALAFLTNAVIFAQTPINDPTWQKDTALGDEFNGHTLNTSKWQALSCYGPGYNWGGSTAFYPAYATVDSGYLKLAVDGSKYCFTNPSDTGYKTAGIWSTNFNYTYGYFEISAELPGNYNSLHQPVGKKFWPGFWTYWDPYETIPGVRCIDSIHNEIDILEPSGTQYNGTTNVCGFWHEVDTAVCYYRPYPSCACYARNATKEVQYSFTNSTPLFTGFNKYAVEWNSNRMVFYFNDTPIGQSFNNPDFVNQGNQRVVIDQQLDGSVTFDSSTVRIFKKDTLYMRIDYFRYYNLNLDCSHNLTFTKDTDVSNYTNYAVKDTIIFGNGTNSINLTGRINPLRISTFVFRAVNGFRIPKYSSTTFTVLKGTQLLLIPTACH
jgi:beta-glucanase (GH16 family)